MRNTKALIRHIKAHKIFFILAPIIIAFMTYPLAFHILGGNQDWLPSNSPDIFMKFWDSWYLGEIFSGSQDFYFASNLFYPDGTSLVYHNFSLPHMMLMFISTPLLGQIGAYNFSILVLIFITTYAGYLYIFYLTQDKKLSFFGSFMFGISSFTLGHLAHPDLFFLASIPLTLLFIDKGIREGNLRNFVIAGIICGTVVFIGMYIYVCLLIMLVTYTLFVLLEQKKWTNKQVIIGLFTFGVVVGSISLIRIYPMIVNEESLDTVLSKTRNSNGDILTLFVNPEHHFFGNLYTGLTRRVREHGGIHYIGYIPLILILPGLLYFKTRKLMIKWLVIMLIFGTLRLGPELIINDVKTGVILPKKFLDDVLPMVFGSFYNSGHFSIGLTLSITMLSTYGLQALLNFKRIGKYSSIFLVGLILMGALYERTRIYSGILISNEEISFYERLKKENDNIALINIPMSRHDSKRNGFYQTIHNFPHVEGLASRTLPEAYTYINNNLLLSTWEKLEIVQCTSENAEQYKRDLNDLINNKFKYVIIQKQFVENTFYQNFPDIERADETDFVNIYAVSDLVQTCPD